MADSSTPRSAPDDPAAMHRRAREVRAELSECQQTGNYETFGEVIRDTDSTPVAIHLKPERLEDLRCLLSLAKEELGRKKAAPVTLRSAKYYEGVDLFISLDGKAGAGLTRENRIVSFFKAPPNSPKNAMHHRAHDVMNEVILRGGDHLVCLSHMLAYYNKHYGFELLAIVPRSPLDAYPGWTEQNNEDYEEEMRQFTVVTGEGDNQRTVALPYVVMRLNPALHEIIRQDGRLSETSQDFTNLNAFKQVPGVPAAYEEVVRTRAGSSGT